LPSSKSTETLLPFSFATTKSSRPSPFSSSTTTTPGALPTAKRRSLERSVLQLEMTNTHRAETRVIALIMDCSSDGKTRPAKPVRPAGVRSTDRGGDFSGQADNTMLTDRPNGIHSALVLRSVRDVNDHKARFRRVAKELAKIHRKQLKELAD
jgi:hypothetical protein